MEIEKFKNSLVVLRIILEEMETIEIIERLEIEKKITRTKRIRNKNS